MSQLYFVNKLTCATQSCAPKTKLARQSNLVRPTLALGRYALKATPGAFWRPRPPPPAPFWLCPSTERRSQPRSQTQQQGGRSTQMAAPVIVVERYRVEHGQGFTMPVISLTDRRAAGNRLVRFVFQRHLETVLYGRSDGSSGPIWKVMNTAGIGSTTMAINKAAVTSGVITEDEFQAVMEAFKSALPADVVDPSSLGRIRNCTIIPLAAAATVVRTFGRCPASTAWLRALSQPIPHAWELREEQEANDAVGEVDFVLEEKLDDANFEADESSFASELMTMPAFSADKDDDARLKTYILQRVPPMLKKELDSYLLFRTQTFAARRAGGAVQSISAQKLTPRLCFASMVG